MTRYRHGELNFGVTAGNQCPRCSRPVVVTVRVVPHAEFEGGRLPQWQRFVKVYVWQCSAQEEHHGSYTEPYEPTATYTKRWIVTDTKIDLRLGTFATEEAAIDFGQSHEYERFSVTVEYVKDRA